MDAWNNDAAKGYALQAMQNAGLNEDTILQVLHGWDTSLTVEEAAKKYQKAYQSGNYTD